MAGKAASGIEERHTRSDMLDAVLGFQKLICLFFDMKRNSGAERAVAYPFKQKASQLACAFA